MPTYRTAGPWGAGSGVNLTPAQVDTNFYELRTDIDDLIANPPAVDSLTSVSASGFNLTFHLTSGATLGPIPLPVVYTVWRGEWTPLTLYSAADIFRVTGEGIFAVMADHTSAATFDPNAIGGSPAEALYTQLIGVSTNATLDDLVDVSAASPVAGQVLRYVGGSPDSAWQPDTLTLDDIDDVVAPTPSLGDVLTWTGSPASWQPAAVATTLDGLTDVIAPSPIAGQVLRYLGGSPDALWQPDTLTLDDINDVDAAAPSLGQVLTWTGSPASWQPTTPGAIPTTLDALTDVTVPSPADGDFLQYQAGSPTGWINAAGSAISGLAGATLPLNTASFLEISEAAGSPVAYTSKKITVANFFTDVTLAGTTTIPGSGQISSAGELGLGAAAANRITVGGTYTTATANYLAFGGTFASSNTGAQTAHIISTTFNPSGASLTSVTGTFTNPTVDNTSLNINNFLTNNAIGVLGASYSGTVTNYLGYNAGQAGFNGGTITNHTQFRANTVSINDGAASGTKTNRQFQAVGITAGAAGATINNRGMEITVPSGGASSGTANNRGLYVTGNGGTASGSPPGTVNNFAILSDSTAYSRIEGGLGVGVATRNATTATNPYFYIPTCAGTPTGVPRNAAVGATAMVFDDTAHKLWVYEQSTATWKGVVVA